MSKEKSGMERKIYENALFKMEKFGVKSIMNSTLLPNKDRIKASLLVYYESTEEFEKCRFISDFFDSVEREIKIFQILDSPDKK